MIKKMRWVMTAMLFLAFLGMVVSAGLKNPQQPLVPEAADAVATPDTASLKQTTSEPPMPPPHVYGSDDNKAPEPVPAADAPAAVGVEEQTTASLKQTTSEPPMPPPYGSDDNKLAEPAPADAKVVAEPATVKESHPEVYPVNQQAAMPLVPATPAFPPKGLNKKMAKVDLQAENFELKNENTKLKASEKADKHATASRTEAPHADATPASSTPTRQEQIEAAIAQEEDAVHAAIKTKAGAAPTQDQHVNAPAQAEPAQTAKKTTEEAPKTGMLSAQPRPASTENKAAEPAVAAKGDLAAWSPGAKGVKLYTKLADAVGLNVNNMQSDAAKRAHAAAHSSSNSKAKALQLVRTHSSVQQAAGNQTFEHGILHRQLDHRSFELKFDKAFGSQPFVLLGVPTRRGNDPVEPQVRAVSESSVTFELKEPAAHGDGKHGRREGLSWMAMLPDEEREDDDFRVGQVSVNCNEPNYQMHVQFGRSFSSQKDVVVVLTSGGSPSYLAYRIQSTSQAGFTVKIQGAGAHGDSSKCKSHTLTYFAIEAGQGEMPNGVRYRAFITNQEVGHQWVKKELKTELGYTLGSKPHVFATPGNRGGQAVRLRLKYAGEGNVKFMMQECTKCGFDGTHTKEKMYVFVLSGQREEERNDMVQPTKIIHAGNSNEAHESFGFAPIASNHECGMQAFPADADDVAMSSNASNVSTSLDNLTRLSECDPDIRRVFQRDRLGCHLATGITPPPPPPSRSYTCFREDSRARHLFTEKDVKLSFCNKYSFRVTAYWVGYPRLTGNQERAFDHFGPCYQGLEHEMETLDENECLTVDAFEEFPFRFRQSATGEEVFFMVTKKYMTSEYDSTVDAFLVNVGTSDWDDTHAFKNLNLVTCPSTAALIRRGLLTPDQVGRVSFADMAEALRRTRTPKPPHENTMLRDRVWKIAVDTCSTMTTWPTMCSITSFTPAGGIARIDTLQIPCPKLRNGPASEDPDNYFFNVYDMDLSVFEHMKGDTGSRDPYFNPEKIRALKLAAFESDSSTTRVTRSVLMARLSVFDEQVDTDELDSSNHHEGALTIHTVTLGTYGTNANGEYDTSDVVPSTYVEDKHLNAEELIEMLYEKNTVPDDFPVWGCNSTGCSNEPWSSPRMAAHLANTECCEAPTAAFESLDEDRVPLVYCSLC